MAIVRALERYAERRRTAIAPSRADEERCEVCGAPIGGAHAHVVDRDRRALLCSCTSCATLFRDPRASSGRFRAVPDRVLTRRSPRIADEAWRALGIPVGLAFIVHDSRAERWRCVYPSPGGPVESEIDASAWHALAELEPLARAPIDDVEALLVRRSRAGTFECFVTAIDQCYALVGAVRERWRGIDGGDDARAAIDDFFARLRARGVALDENGGETS